MSRSSRSDSPESDVVDLDAAETYERLDPDRMRDRIRGLAAQSQDAWGLGRSWSIPQSLRQPPSRVLILAIGGSAIGADAVATLAGITSTVPVQLVRNYALPTIDERTLVVACSFSGETEETLTAFRAALALSGPRLAITTGGTLARMAAEANVPLFRYRFDGQPRSALGYGIFALLAILSRLGVLPIDDPTVQEALSGLAQDAASLAPEVASADNAAKRIAVRIRGQIPIMVGADFLDVAARRWAAQVSENAKQWAFAVALPEVNHNLIVGFGSPADAREHLRPLILDAEPVHARNRLRVALTLRELGSAGVQAEVVPVPGTTPLAAIVRACFLGDWVSLYLAMLNGADPSTTEPIDRLKAELGKQPRA